MSSSQFRGLKAKPTDKTSKKEVKLPPVSIFSPLHPTLKPKHAELKKLPHAVKFRSIVPLHPKQSSSPGTKIETKPSAAAPIEIKPRASASKNPYIIKFLKDGVLSFEENGISEDRITDSDIDELIDQLHLIRGKVKALDFSTQRSIPPQYRRCITDIGLKNLIIQLREFPEITELDMSYNRITDQGLQDFAEQNTTITKARFSNNDITDQGLKIFAKVNKTTTNVAFSSNYDCVTKQDSTSKITARGLWIFAHLNTAVTSLTVTCVDLTRTHDSLLGPFASSNRVITDVAFRGCGINTEGIISFASQNDVVTSIDLSSNWINLNGIEGLIQFNRKLQKVDLGHNLLCDDSLIHIAKHNKHIIELQVQLNYITNRGAREFARHNKVITTLGLGFNKVADQGAKDFFEYNTCVTTLDLDGSTSPYKKNKPLSEQVITDEGALVFLKQHIISKLILEGGYVSPSVYKQIADHIAIREFYWAKYGTLFAGRRKVEAKDPHYKDAFFRLMPTILKFCYKEEEIKKFDSELRLYSAKKLR